MLRLIIADDEKIIRETIRDFIDWKSLGIEVVAVCKNGLEAYDAIIDEYPDIVLTDIKMPGLTGLDLIEKLTQTHEHIHFIILSGFGEFEYAKKAMRYGIKHYLLKPCNEQQIIAAVEDVKQLCLKNREKDRPIGFEKSLFRTFITECITSSIDSAVQSHAGYVDFYNSPYVLHYFYFLEEHNLQDSCRYIAENMKTYYPDIIYYLFYVKNTLLVIIKDTENLKDAFSRLLGGLEFPEQPVQISFECQCFENLALLYPELIRKLKRYDKIYYLEDTHKIPIFNYNTFLTLAQQACRKYDNQEIDAPCLKKELSELFASTADKDFLLYLLTDLLLKNSRQHACGAPLSSVEFFQTVNAAENAAEITETFFKCFDSFFPPSPCCTVYKPFIEKLLNYMEEHLSNPNLSLKWLAGNYLYMNVDYVSKQFSRQTGEKFSNYLNQMRISKAKSLLIDCDTEKIYTIAEQVGCGNNPQYFSQLFKKYTGTTPTEYMKKMTGRE